jgi:hypothetical protein
MQLTQAQSHVIAFWVREVVKPGTIERLVGLVALFFDAFERACPDNAHQSSLCSGPSQSNVRMFRVFGTGICHKARRNGTEPS